MSEFDLPVGVADAGTPTSASEGPTPRVAVIVPTHGRSEFVARAIESVIAQTVRELELLVVDDNDPGDPARESTRRVIAAYAADDRIRYLEHHQNRGGAAARNTGIKAARAPFVAFLDDDDTWDPIKLERQLSVVEGDARVALAYCRARVVHPDGSTTEPDAAPPRHSLRDLLRRNEIGSTSVVLCRRDALLEVGGFDEELPAKQDIDLYVRLAARYPLAMVDDVLATIHRHAAPSIGKDLGAAIIAHRHFHEKHHALFVGKRDVEHHRYRALGRLLLRSGRYVEARRVLLDAVAARPAHVETLALLALTTGAVRLLLKHTKLARHLPEASGRRRSSGAPRSGGGPGSGDTGA